MSNKPKLVAPPGACDTHIHLFVPGSSYAPDSPYRAKDAPPEMFFELQKKLGLSTAVIVSPGGYGRDTSMLADVLAKHPERFRGIALVKDDIEPSELARLTRLGVKGMRMMSNERGQHVPNFDPASPPRSTSTAGTSSSIRTAPTSPNTPTSCCR